MREIHLPLPEIDESDLIEITLEVKNKNIQQNFRIETFDCSDEQISGSSNIFNRVDLLKVQIEKYDKNWDLLQIFLIEENSAHIKVLMKKNQL